VDPSPRTDPLNAGAEHVFTVTGKTPVSGWSNAKRQLPALDPPWVIHDLRRTVATGLQKLGVPLQVTEAVLGHVAGSRAGIIGIYQRHEYADEKRAALETWARHVAQKMTK
jgi:integrase